MSVLPFSLGTSLILGGFFIPMVNIERIFANVIKMISIEGDTTRQALRHISLDEIEENSTFKYRLIQGQVNGMIP